MIVQSKKSLVLTAAVLFGGAFSSFAQTGSPQTDTEEFAFTVRLPPKWPAM